MANSKEFMLVEKHSSDVATINTKINTQKTDLENKMGNLTLKDGVSKLSDLDVRFNGGDTFNMYTPSGWEFLEVRARNQITFVGSVPQVHQTLNNRDANLNELVVLKKHNKDIADLNSKINALSTSTSGHSTFKDGKTTTQMVDLQTLPNGLEIHSGGFRAMNFDLFQGTYFTKIPKINAV